MGCSMFLHLTMLPADPKILWPRLHTAYPLLVDFDVLGEVGVAVVAILELYLSLESAYTER
jgi:hypothetical protein